MLHSDQKCDIITIEQIAEKLARAMGHTLTCRKNTTPCSCGAGPEQAEAIYLGNYILNFPKKRKDFMSEKELRQHPFVVSWIAEYQKDAWHKYPDCYCCGFPHAENLLCNGAPFGRLYIGAESYSVDISNVEYFVKFREKQRPGFHWRDDIYFLRMADGGVLVTSFWRYNNFPQEKKWTIDRDSWASIVSSVSAEGETAESWQNVKAFHEGTEKLSI